MPQNFLDCTSWTSANSKHCYLNGGRRVMLSDMLRAISEDFLQSISHCHEASSAVVYHTRIEICEIVQDEVKKR